VQLIKMAPAWWLQYFSFVLFNLSLSMLAGGIVRYVSPQAAGTPTTERLADAGRQAAFSRARLTQAAASPR